MLGLAIFLSQKSFPFLCNLFVYYKFASFRLVHRSNFVTRETMYQIYIEKIWNISECKIFSNSNATNISLQLLLHFLFIHYNDYTPTFPSLLRKKSKLLQKILLKSMFFSFFWRIRKQTVVWFDLKLLADVTYIYHE